VAFNFGEEFAMPEYLGFQQGLHAADVLAEGISARRENLAEEAARDAGFPVKVSLMEADLASNHLRTMEEEIHLVQGGDPYGTVAAIFPYDAPVVMLARLGGAALLSGNGLRFGFSSWTPRTAKLLAEIAGPVSSFEPVRGENNRDFGRRCVNDEAVRVLFISGASAVGESYRAQRDHFDKVFFAGPGGMPVCMVFPDADPERASRFIVQRAFINGGQYCTTLKKALIHEALYENVRKRVLELAGELKVGDPLALETDIGPILVERTVKLLESALKRFEGGALLAGGIDGEWVYPMIYETEEIPDLELFGPFLALKQFRDPENAVREVVSSRYGFLAALFGTPPETAKATLESNFGMVFDNPDFLFTPLRAAFGGKKASGWILERHGNGWNERDGAFLYARELVKRGDV
jgi:acyl-CoA reductase-like NAD-dependent aldehyde dehydrogenase